MSLRMAGDARSVPAGRRTPLPPEVVLDEEVGATGSKAGPQPIPLRARHQLRRL